MTKYDIAEFKAWLEEKLERKNKIVLSRIEGTLQSGVDLDTFFAKLMEKSHWQGFNFKLEDYDSWRQLVQEFIAEREREREQLKEQTIIW